MLQEARNRRQECHMLVRSTKRLWF
ncbi:hypothetical protein CBM2626_A40327 [Cupriavidus taiwanensis]|nr:hypothetical protein CBM2626_A40327 [Cupriavidus taiwanensis]